MRTTRIGKEAPFAHSLTSVTTASDVTVRVPSADLWKLWVRIGR